MALKPEFSIPTGLAVATVVYAIHTNSTPSTADIQALPAGTEDIDRAERQATWMSAAVVSGISLIAKDPTILVIGATAVIGMAVITRHANWTESATGWLITPSEKASAGSANTGPELAQTEPTTVFAAAGSEFTR